MKFTKAKIQGAYLIDLEKREDDRGFFARAFCNREFTDQGLATDFVQTNISCNKQKGTIRGLHYQTKPHEEIKLMRCIFGEMFDVIVDLRTDSPTYLQWEGFHLSAENRKALYIPAGCANGYQALQDNTEAMYSVTQAYTPGAEKGIRWNDPKFTIQWSIVDNVIVSEKDKAWEDYK